MKCSLLRRPTAIFLAALLLTSTLAACGQTASDTTDTTAAPDTAVTTAVPEVTEAPETEYPAPQVENTDYKGQTFRILANEPRTEFPYSEIYYSDEQGDIINDALFRRNNQIVDKYGVTIETTDASTGAGLKTFTNAILADTGDFHFASIRICDIMSAASQGYLADVSTLPYLSLDAPWYYQNMRKSLSIGGEEYLLIGYFNMRVFDTLTFMAYNKNLAEKYQISGLNELALDGKWTVTKMHEYATQVSVDVNQDGKLWSEDQIGLKSHSGYILSFFVGMGGTFVEKDENDLPIYSGLSAKNEQLLSDLVKVIYDDASAIHGLHANITFENDPFAEDMMLFTPQLVYGMRYLSETGVNYGILPFPKANENQENYISHTHSKLGTAIGIPNNNRDMEMTAAIVADMMYLSHKIIYPAHIEKAMQMRYSPEESSTEMLKLLFGSLCIEMSTALNLKIDTQLRNMGTTKADNFASVFAGIKSSDAKTLETYVATFTQKN